MTDEIIEQPDLSTMDTADLAELIDNPHTEDEAPVEEEPVEPEPTEADPEDEATEAEDESAEETTDEGEEEELDAASLRSELEQLRAERKHFESVAGRNAGEAGYLRQQLQSQKEAWAQYRNEVEQSSKETDDYHRPAEAQSRPQQPLGSEQDARFAQSAMALGAQAFTLENPDAMVTDKATGQEVFDPELARLIQESGADMQNVLESRDGSFIMNQTKLLLESSYRKLQADRIASERASRASSGVDQSEKLTRRKRASAAASGGGVSAATPLKHVTPEDLSTEALAREIERRNR